MSRLIMFNSVSIDGYFVDISGDMSWAHNPVHDEEWNDFVSGNASGGGLLIFGRITYEMMAAYWPTSAAKKNYPVVAEGMNSINKLVFSKTMKSTDWNNTRVVNTDMIDEIKKLKKESVTDMVILGSGSIVAQLTKEHLIDEYQIVMVPVIIGKGRTLFENVDEKINLKLASTRSFANGNVLLCYNA